jgi:hypothetical protein
MEKRYKISGEQAKLARMKLQEAFFTSESIDISQRRLFFRLMPELYLLRTHNKLTFEEVTKLLTECGFKLSESAVRVYYFTFYVKLQDSLGNASQELIEKKEALRRLVEQAEYAEVTENFAEMLKSYGR